MCYRAHCTFTSDKRKLKAASPREIMAQTETFSCSICLDLVTDPVTIPCGHKYCLSCIQSHWDKEEEKEHYSCPQCRKSFRSRPVLVKNTLLAALVEDVGKATLTDHVQCDVCIETKENAVKSCLQCLASYCETHLQPHYLAVPLKKHKLIEPTPHLQDNICSMHDEPMKMFCRKDQECICYLCSVGHHKGHDIVSAAAEETQRQREVEARRGELLQKILDKHNYLQEVKQQVNTVNASADQAVQQSEKRFTRMVQLLENLRGAVEWQVRSKQETEISRIKTSQETIEQEIAKLKKKVSDLDALGQIKDANQFLNKSTPILKICENIDSAEAGTQASGYFKNITADVFSLSRQIHQAACDNLVRILGSRHQATGKVKYFHDITLDPKSANSMLELSDDDRKVRVSWKSQNYPEHPERFTFWQQVLSKTTVPSLCYFEVEWSGGTVGIALAYKTIQRSGSGEECRFGFNDNSWVLQCDRREGYSFGFNNVWSQVTGPDCDKIGVYVDQRLGEMAFYSATQTMTLLHKVRTTFTQPLHIGLHFNWLSEGAHFPKLY